MRMRTSLAVPPRPLALAALLAAAAGCGGDDSDSSGASPAPAPPPSGAAAKPQPRVASYGIHYGPMTDADIELAKTFPLVIVHPTAGRMTRDQIARIQRGVDPADPADDVLVLGYVSVGEDLRTVGLTDEELQADARFRGDGTGPRVDPRGPDADGAPLDGLDPRGQASNGGGGFASWYLDDNSIDRSPERRGDGRPDRNGKFGGCFVNAGDPAWFDALDAMILDEPHGQAGLRELLTTEHGRGFGCDGLFLDTIDTAAPNSFTFAGSENPSEFEWTAPGFRDFIRRLRETYPGKRILQNRGLFFFDPRYPQYRHTTRPYVDYVLYESFRLNSNTWEQYNPQHFADNLHNVAPKLRAEADRPDGFQVLSLGYAVGPGIDPATLTGGSTAGLDTLLEDIRVTQEVAGFRHHLTEEPIRVHSFVRDQPAPADRAAPVWSSTWNINRAGDLAQAPTPRIGLQEAVGLPGGRLLVRWDVALDAAPVRYVLYAGAAPPADAALAGFRRIPLDPVPGDGYGSGDPATTYAHQAVVDGFAPGAPVHLVLRAIDALGNEETNVAASSTQLSVPKGLGTRRGASAWSAHWPSMRSRYWYWPGSRDRVARNSPWDPRFRGMPSGDQPVKSPVMTTSAACWARTVTATARLAAGAGPGLRCGARMGVPPPSAGRGAGPEAPGGRTVRYRAGAPGAVTGARLISGMTAPRASRADAGRRGGPSRAAGSSGRGRPGRSGRNPWRGRHGRCGSGARTSAPSPAPGPRGCGRRPSSARSGGTPA
jgi:hypothetical protein